jgi:phage regulator Rha-like protein
VTLEKGRGKYSKYNSLVFTEHGVAMLSSVLKSERAIQTNIQIIRTFGKLREMLATNVDLRKKLAEMEKKYDSQFRVVFDAIKKMLELEVTPKRRIGF